MTRFFSGIGAIRYGWRTLAAACLISSPAVAAECVSIDPPASWSASAPAEPVAVLPAPAAIAPLRLVIFRHAEKPLRDDGVMIEDGNLGGDATRRLSQLPDRLLKAFGCPDMLVTANPAVKMLNRKTGKYFNYVRLLATIEPLSVRLNFPVWTPYGYDQTEALARDLLGDKAFAASRDGKARTIFIAWERNNIRALHDNLLRLGQLKTPAAGALTVDGETFRCKPPPKWEQCDFDSIWLIQIRDGALCLTHRNENLNTPAFLKRCRGAESTTDSP